MALAATAVGVGGCGSSAANGNDASVPKLAAGAPKYCQSLTSQSVQQLAVDIPKIAYGGASVAQIRQETSALRSAASSASPQLGKRMRDVATAVDAFTSQRTSRARMDSVVTSLNQLSVEANKECGLS